MFKVLLIVVAITLLYLMKFSLRSEVHTVLLVVVAAGLLYWLNKIRKKNVFKRHKPIERSPTKIDGFEVQAVLSADTPLECLRHDGLRYGASFRLKTAPPLPHNELCQCKVVNLSYSSSEVFEGALRKNSMRESTLGVLSFAEASVLKDMLKGLHTQIPTDFKEYCQQFDLEPFSEERQAKIVALVRKKFDQFQVQTNSLSPNKEIYQE